ncbi:tetratricopeptide repeat-containing sulfotransferase family protein [Paraburkholderia phytofirmans]|uniref:Tetratricopeptide TPR_2 repeat protein n=1 Tax=Paraburkholderia phytofirmans (strain DSM 17436 / LMG 22146 / PsJN) TaxID=398527 RepID=B2T3K4_PARPJ|nr:sulfotransferase [Paraburkholderia phytofirmans]ACD16165.1 Tetratricopeptide TPR_2 repeat protein [Paraburkholderia phytofirmans PsJN]
MKQDPQPAVAREWRAEGDACAARGELDAALQRYESARALDPTDALVQQRLAATLAALNRFPEAVVRYHEAIALDPRDKDSHHGLGWTLEQMHRLEQAVDAYREATRVNPQADGSHNNMGNCLQALGRFDEAHEAYRRAIEAAPQVPLYYRNFVQSKRLAADDPVFLAMERLVVDAASLTPANQAELHFAYGQALSDVGCNDASFDHFLKGNALHRAGVRYNEAETLGLFAHLPELMTAELLASKRGLGDASQAPIFIVGMPRSGSTLIEQILASHPQVFGAGERTEFGEALVNCIRRDLDDPLRIDIEALEEVGAAPLRALGVDYLRRMRNALPELQSRAQNDQRNPAANYTHFTDKYPFNFINLGLIHLALPNARFIHSSRAPLPTCLSIFSRIFHDVPFSYDLGELGRYYRAYDALMAHWQRVLPEGVMIEVKYEELVDDFEANVHRLLAHCGLEWDERCLSFYQTARQVNTASSAQVRRPLYKTSLQRWQPPRALLQPLLDGLGSELAAAHRHETGEVEASGTEHRS